MIGFLSEYATYLYALRIGIRPPLEGIPYLTATVTAGSLFLALSASIAFMIARWIAAKIAGKIIDTIRDVSLNANKIGALFSSLFETKIEKVDYENLIQKI